MSTENNKDNETIANADITASQVRLIHAPTKFDAVMATEDALAIADAEDLDLVQVSSQDVPIVKLLDLNKHLYDQKQKEKAMKKSQRASAVIIKETQLRVTIESNDLLLKLNKSKAFINEGKQLRVCMRLRGRDNKNPDTVAKGIEIVNNFINSLGDVVIVSNSRYTGNMITAHVKPR